MKILLINKFLYPKGGDAITALDTGKLLKNKGNNVVFWGMDDIRNGDFNNKDTFVSNIDFNSEKRVAKKIKAALNLLYSFEAKQKIERVILREKPDIVHLNNFAHQISPSILDVFKKYKLPAVMTMHDYKLVCASYTLKVKEKACQACSGGRHYNCFLKACVKNSRAKSFLNMIEMYLHHNLLHIYDSIRCFISPSLFLKEKVKAMGFKKKIVHLPNFVDIDNFLPQYDWQDNSIVYVGRLSFEKGVMSLIKAASFIPDIKFKIVGDGPLMEELKDLVKMRNISNVEFLGYKSGKELKDEIRKSMCVVVPSQCYENNPRAAIEAFALGKSVIGARIGGIPELVKDNITGVTFNSGDVDDLVEKISLVTKDNRRLKKWAKSARDTAEKEYSADVYYDKLISIYKDVIDNAA